MADEPLLPFLGRDSPSGKTALRFPGSTLDYGALRRSAARVASGVAGAGRVAVWAEAGLETCVAVVGALAAGVPCVPINPRSGQLELEHILADSAPGLLLTAPGTAVPGALGKLERAVVELDVREPADLPPEPPADAPALVVYTSGTTGPPKGAVLPRRAIASNLDALAEAWEWTQDDVVVHGLPLFHVHGLVMGILGPLRLGGIAHHLGRFSPEATAEALTGDGTVLFGVPTMYRRLVEAAERDAGLAAALGLARLLVSGSAPLPAAEHERLERLTGQRAIERYGMTETLMTTAVRASGDRRAGFVGPALDGVELRLIDDDGGELEASGDETIGEILVRGPNLFLEYLNRPDATAEAFTDGWFRTGDLATRSSDGYFRIVGRRATDLIKSGGFKIGAGEIEAALRAHAGVDDAAVTGAPDPDLGEHVVAWVVRKGEQLTEQELVDHVTAMLAPHKRPRVVHFVDELPRNELGKVQKIRLTTG